MLIFFRVPSFLVQVNLFLCLPSCCFWTGDFEWEWGAPVVMWIFHLDMQNSASSQPKHCRHLPTAPAAANAAWPFYYTFSKILLRMPLLETVLEMFHDFLCEMRRFFFPVEFWFNSARREACTSPATPIQLTTVFFRSYMISTRSESCLLVLMHCFPP